MNNKHIDSELLTEELRGKTKNVANSKDTSHQKDALKYVAKEKEIIHNTPFTQEEILNYEINSKPIIPKSFKLFASTIEVVFDNERLKDHTALGLSEYNKHKISLATNSDYGILNKDIVLDTFYHEKVHMILDAMGNHDLSGNEVFVDTFGKLLRQSDETAEY